MNFENVRLLGYAQRNEFLGDNYRYVSRKELTIEGTINSATADGVSSIVNQMEDYSISTAPDFQDIFLNGVNYGKGRINSIRFKEGNDVLRKDYTASITINGVGDLTKLPITLPHPTAIETFSESVDYAVKEDGTETTRQNVNVKYTPGAIPGQNDAIVMAKSLASGLFSNTPASEYIDGTGGQVTFVETYNVLTFECSFSKTIEKVKGSTSTYSLKYTHELSTDDKNVTTVTENGTIRPLTTTNRLTAAEGGYSSAIGGAAGRCGSVFSQYATGDALINTAIGKSKRVNQVTGEINYSISFTNNPNYNGLYFWDYTQTLNKESGTCFYNVAERGTIRGRDCGQVNHFTNASNAWGQKKSGIGGRLGTFYNSATGLSNTLKAVSVSEKKSEHAGTIEYNSTFTDDPNYNISAKIKRVDYKIDDSEPVQKFNRFNILGVKELAQKAYIATQGTRSFSVTVQGRRAAVFKDCYDEGKNMAKNNKPAGEFVYISDCSYTYNPPERRLELTVTWNYLGPAKSSFTA